MSTSLLLSVLGYSALVFAVLMVFIFFSMFLAALREVIAIQLINNAFGIFGVIFKAIMDGVEFVAGILAKIVAWAWAGMKTAWERIGQTRIANQLGALDILSATFFLIIFLILALGDAYFAAISLPELFRTTPPNLNPNLFTPMLVGYWICIIVGIFSAAGDVFGLTHLLPPYVGGTGRIQRVLRITVLVSVVLLMIAAIDYGLFRQELSSGTDVTLVDNVLNVLLFVLGFVATAIVGVPVGYEALALLVLLPSILLVIPQILAFLLKLPVAVLNKIAAVAVAFYDMLATLGYNFWNWICSTDRGRCWHLPPIKQFTPRPDIVT